MLRHDIDLREMAVVKICLARRSTRQDEGRGRDCQEKKLSSYLILARIMPSSRAIIRVAEAGSGLSCIARLVCGQEQDSQWLPHIKTSSVSMLHLQGYELFDMAHP